MSGQRQWSAASRLQVGLPGALGVRSMARSKAKPAVFEVTVKNWHAVANWTWDAGDDVCGICRMPFDGCAPLSSATICTIDTCVVHGNSANAGFHVVIQCETPVPGLSGCHAAPVCCRMLSRHQICYLRRNVSAGSATPEAHHCPALGMQTAMILALKLAETAKHALCCEVLCRCPPDGKYPGDDSPVVWGTCTHAFHLQARRPLRAALCEVDLVIDERAFHATMVACC